MELIDKAAVVAEIKRISCENPMDNSWYVDTEELLDFLDTLEVKLEVEEESVSEELEEIAWNHADKKCHLDIAVFTPDEVKKERGKMQFTWQDLYDAVMFGAKWQKIKDESTTEDLGDYINELSKQFPEVSFAKLSRIAVRVSRWQKNHLWKPADGDDLPEYDREVIVLTQPYPLEDSEYAVYFAHRPDPKDWDGKNITTGEVEHYTPKTYDKGGWNIPDVKYWLNVKFPKEIEL